MMSPVNVVVSGLPQCGVLCLKLGDTCRGVTTMEVEHAICSATGMPQESMFLRAGTRLLLGPTELVCTAGTHTAFVCAGLRRALPGGKGGFGAQLRGASSKSGGPQTTNIDACRDLHGRRIGAVRRERAAAEALARARAQTQGGVEQEPVADRDRIGDCFQNRTKHQRKRGRTQSADQSAPLVAMKEGRMPNGVAQYVQEVAAHVDDAVRDGLRIGAGYHEDGATHVGGSSGGSGSNSCSDSDLDGDIVGGGGGGGGGRNSKRRRTSDDPGNGLTLLDAYGSCSSSGDERCANGDDSDGADEHMRDA